MDEELRKNEIEASAAEAEASTVQESAEAEASTVQESAEAEASTVQESAEAEAPARQASAPVSPSVDWRFGEGAKDAAPKKRKNGYGGFFAMFGAVVGVCMLLLIGVICLGDGSFQIIRNLKTERVVYVREDDGSSGLLTPNEAAQKISASTVTILIRTETAEGNGSGIIYTEDGYILTNHHAVRDAVSLQVMLQDGQCYDATVVGSDAKGDLAVLKIEATGLTPAEFGSSADLLVGDAVLAVGTPVGPEYAGTVTFGSVSATGRLVPIFNSTTGALERKMTLIQTDATVNPGNSGGPLADMYGRVVGVVVMRISQYGGNTYEGIGMALPIDGVKVVADEIIRTGSFQGAHPYVEGRSLLGLTGHGGEKGVWYSDAADPETGTMAASEVEKEGYHLMRERGVYVLGVNGVNAAGKLQKGDIVMKVNGQNVYITNDLIDIANRYHVGESVTLTISRGDQVLTVTIVLAEEPLG